MDPSTPTPQARTIVVGVDGTDSSAEALHWAASVALDRGATVVAVTAVTPLAGVLSDSVHISGGDWRHALRLRVRDEWCRPLVEAGIDHRVRLIERHAGAALIQAATEEHATLLVVGVHQHHSLAGKLSTYLNQHAPCPVVAVPLPATTPTTA